MTYLQISNVLVSRRTVNDPFFTEFQPIVLFALGSIVNDQSRLFSGKVNPPDFTHSFAIFGVILFSYDLTFRATLNVLLLLCKVFYLSTIYNGLRFVPGVWDKTNIMSIPFIMTIFQLLSCFGTYKTVSHYEIANSQNFMTLSENVLCISLPFIFYTFLLSDDIQQLGVISCKLLHFKGLGFISIVQEKVNFIVIYSPYLCFLQQNIIAHQIFSCSYGFRLCSL